MVVAVVRVRVVVEFILVGGVARGVLAGHGEGQGGRRGPEYGRGWGLPCLGEITPREVGRSSVRGSTSSFAFRRRKATGVSWSVSGDVFFLGLSQIRSKHQEASVDRVRMPPVEPPKGKQKQRLATLYRCAVSINVSALNTTVQF